MLECSDVLRENETCEFQKTMSRKLLIVNSAIQQSETVHIISKQNIHISFNSLQNRYHLSEPLKQIVKRDLHTSNPHMTPFQWNLTPSSLSDNLISSENE